MLKIGDTIHCLSPREAAYIAERLGRDGYDWEFMYEKDGEQGIWIVIEGIPEEEQP